MSVVMPGSHRSLQQELLCVQVPVRWQVTGWTQVPEMQNREQHCSDWVHGLCAARQMDASTAASRSSRTDASVTPPTSLGW
ncbi:MAG TPA: hypothetical protein VF881_05765 [Polyangiaceae bacterium]